MMISTHRSRYCIDMRPIYVWGAGAAACCIQVVEAEQLMAGVPIMNSRGAKPQIAPPSLGPRGRYSWRG